MRCLIDDLVTVLLNGLIGGRDLSAGGIGDRGRSGVRNGCRSGISNRGRSGVGDSGSSSGIGNGGSQSGGVGESVTGEPIAVTIRIGVGGVRKDGGLSHFTGSSHGNQDSQDSLKAKIKIDDCNSR